MIEDKIHKYLERMSFTLNEDIDSLDITDKIVRLLETLDDDVLDSYQIKLRNDILNSIGVYSIKNDNQLTDKEDSI